LENDGRLRIVDDPATADLVLSGVLTVFDPHAISFVADDEIGQFRISIAATAALEAVREGETLWQEEAVWGSDFYLTSGGRMREDAIDEALEELAENIIHGALDNYW